MIRERVLGIGHPETHYHIKYRGAIYADVGRLDRCIALWQYALSLQVRGVCNRLRFVTNTQAAFLYDFFIGKECTACFVQSFSLPFPNPLSFHE